MTNQLELSISLRAEPRVPNSFHLVLGSPPILRRGVELLTP
jgi:hypothetical protein